MDTTKPLGPVDALDPARNADATEPLKRLEGGDAPEPGERAAELDSASGRSKPAREPLNLDDLFDL